MRHNNFIALSTSALGDLRAAKASLSARYLLPRTATASSLSQPTSPAPAHNVVGVGVGEKYSVGQPTGVLAVKLFVRRKYPVGQLGDQNALPEMIDGLPTDVEAVGTFQFAKTLAAPAPMVQIPNPRIRIRPAHPGSSIGFLDPGNPGARNAGTFGALVTDGSQRYILSNNHVLANQDQLSEGTPIVQPGTFEGGNSQKDVVAHLSKAVKLQAGTANDVDAAIAALTSPAIASPDVLYIGPPAGVDTATIDMPVQKFGRTTSYTAGRVISVDTDVTVEYDQGNLLFQEQIVIVGTGSASFSDKGDSGSLILERGTNQAVGLLFASSPTHTIANHLQKVLDALAVTLV